MRLPPESFASQTLTDGSGVVQSGIAAPEYAEAWAGVALANGSHLVSVLVLYYLTIEVFARYDQSRVIAFLASCLHTLSPAGLFLCAPYSEAVFSSLNFLGYFFFAKSLRRSELHGRWRDLYLLLAGSCIGLATMVRSNGILSGILFVVDGLAVGLRFLFEESSVSHFQRGVMAVLAATIVAFLSILPQYIAHQQFCGTRQNGEAERPWCNAWIPSVYAWVQSHYW